MIKSSIWKQRSSSRQRIVGGNGTSVIQRNNTYEVDADVNQDDIDAINAKNAQQDQAIDNNTSKNLEQDQSIANNTSKNAQQDQSITELEADIVRIDDKNDQQDEDISGRMRWRGVWQPQTSYLTHDVVKDANYLAIANQATLTRPTPVLEGDPFWRSGLDDAPPWATLQNQASMMVVGQRFAIANSGVLQRVRVWIPQANAPLQYAVWVVLNPEGENATYENLVPEFVPAAGEMDKWFSINVSSRFYSPGQVVDLIKVVRNLAVDTQFSGTWAYKSRNGAPLEGEAWHQNKIGLIRVHYTDAGAVDNRTKLQSLVPGDRFTFNGVTYEILSVAINATDIELGVSPQLRQPDASYEFTFLKYNLTTIEYSRIDDHYAGDAGVQGFENAGQWAPDLPKNEHAYGIDLEVQRATLSDHWDIMAISS